MGYLDPTQEKRTPILRITTINTKIKVYYL